MESLLRWGLEHSDPAAAPPAPRTDLDPAIIDAILGKPDAERMKDALARALDEHRSDAERVQALDDLEMVRPPAARTRPSSADLRSCPAARRADRQRKQ